MDSQEIRLDTGRRPSVVDLTPETLRFCENKGDGLLSIFLPHATAGLALFETGAGSESDVLAVIDELLPADDRWRHKHGSRGHGRDHVLPAFIGPSLTIPVIDSRPMLGTWQSIVLVDINVDNPSRRVRFSFLSG